MSRARAPVAVTAIAIALGAGGCTRSGEVLRVSDGAAPVVLQLTDVRLAAGFGHACAVTSGVLHCWASRPRMPAPDWRR